MKIIISDWLYGIGKIWKNITISIIAFILFFLLFGNLLLYTKDEKVNLNIQNKKNGHIYCSLYRTAADSSNYRIRERPFFLEGMKSTLLKLRGDKNYKYIAINEESYAVIDTETLSAHFKNNNYQDFLSGALYQGYYDKYPEEIENIKLENGKSARRILACKMDYNAIQHYKLQVSQGTLFEKKDYIFDIHDKKISVILGAQYQNYFKVGDEMDMHLYGLDVKAKVKGILEPNTVIENDRSFEYMEDKPKTLDFSILIPYFGIKGVVYGEDEKGFVDVEYVNQLSGILIFDKNVAQEKIYNVLKGVNDYYLESGIFTVNSDVTASGFYFFQGEYSENMQILFILILILMCMCISNLYLSTLNNIESRIYTYAIQIMNGKSVKRIYLENIVEVVFVIMVSVLIVFSLNKHWFYQNILFYIKFFFVVVGALFMNGLLVIRKFKRMDIEQIMRRDIE